MTVSQHTAGSASHAGDMRKSRRLEVRLAAALLSDHCEATGQVANLSRNGSCIEGDKALADLLLAAGRRATGTASDMVQVRFDVPAGAAGTVSVTVQARIVYVVHMHADTYRCGLEFSLFTEGEAVFAAYLCANGLPD
ncbi:MAG TPA: PilZ domain-containing protein [Gammaproteobacteria bacterium]|nr:PilZ domain-containing protein [Gammaproteobacteria bacterium]